MNSLSAFKSGPVRYIAVLLVLAALILFVAACIAPRPGPPHQDIFTGIVTLDQSGEATIAVPSSVAAQYTISGYQATSMGTPMPNLYLKSEIQNGHFTIAGGTPGGLVMWQLFAVSEAR